jgi:PQQ-dependent catabolism-associated CXXCW motif protein
VTRRLLPALLIVLLAGAGESPPEPSSYRMEDYRAAVPATLQGATVLDTARAHALWETRAAVFVDVLPRPPRPAGLPAGTIWHPKPREDLPGSIWLPDTGYGALASAMEEYFASNLQRASEGDRDRPVVFYCLARCWMSWNAAKRALALGYTHVDWYPDGTDGWAEAGLPLELREPVPRPEE